MRTNANLDFQNKLRITNLPEPTSAQEPATKAFAESQGSVAVKYIEKPVRVAAGANVSVASAPAAINGVALAPGDRLLLTAQTENHQNGTYTFAEATKPLVRTTDVFLNGSAVVVSSDDTKWPESVWVQTTDAPEVGTTALTFVQVGPGALSFEAEFGDGASASFEFAHGLKASHPSVVIVNNATKEIETCNVQYVSATKVKLSGEGWTATPPTANAYTVVMRG